MICTGPGCNRPADEGRTVCFKHHIAGIGFTFTGGGHQGQGAFHQTQREYLSEHMGVSSEKELLKEKPNLEKYVS